MAIIGLVYISPRGKSVPNMKLGGAAPRGQWGPTGKETSWSGMKQQELLGAASVLGAVGRLVGREKTPTRKQQTGLKAPSNSGDFCTCLLFQWGTDRFWWEPVTTNWDASFMFPLLKLWADSAWRQNVSLNLKLFPGSHVWKPWRATRKQFLFYLVFLMRGFSKHHYVLFFPDIKSYVLK